MAKLTAKQERFCQEYVIDSNGTQAAIRVGYAERSAQMQSSRLLSKDIVRSRVARLQARAARVAGLSAAFVIEGFIEVYERCMQKVPVTNDYGSPTGFTFNANGANRALELLGKHLELFAGKADDGAQKQTIEIILSAGNGTAGVDPLARRLTGVQNGNN